MEPRHHAFWIRLVRRTGRRWRRHDWKASHRDGCVLRDWDRDGAGPGWRRGEVTLAVRRVEAGEEVVAEIRGSTGNSAVSARRLDLSDQGSVRHWRSDNTNNVLALAFGVLIVTVIVAGHYGS